MHDTLRHLHEGRRGTGTTLDRFRLNELVSQIAFGGRRGRVYRRIVCLAGVRPGDSVLDVGCSGGYLARKLAAAAGPTGRLVGVDPSAAAIAYAQRRANGAMSFTVGVAQDLPLLDSSFDVVTCTLAMHHVPARQRAAAFGEMYRVTKPGGRLLVADFDPARRPLPLHPGGRRMHRAAATVGSLEELAAAAGYQVESAGHLPLLRYVVAIRPEHQDGRRGLTPLPRCRTRARPSAACLRNRQRSASQGSLTVHAPGSTRAHPPPGCSRLPARGF